jgi:hypothetical protein
MLDSFNNLGCIIMKIKKIKLALLILFVLVSIFSCGENKYRNDKKHGAWTEYLDSLLEKEVAIDSAYFIRKVKYENGMPIGLVSDFYKKNNYLHSEKKLISGPYLNGDNRPKDKYSGLYIEFDSLGKKITKFDYFDEFGFLDLKKKFVTGFDEIQSDSRFDLLFYLSTLNLESNEVESYNKFNKRPDLYYKELGDVISRFKKNQNINNLIEFDSIENFMNFLILDAFSWGAGGLKSVDSIASVEQGTRDFQRNNSNQYSQYQRTCDYCGNHLTSLGNGRFCSLKCESEWDYERRRRNGY